MSPDPQGLARGLNVYRYAENRPNEIGDPLGLDGPCTSTVTGTLPDGTPMSGTGGSKQTRNEAGTPRDPNSKGQWPPSVWNAMQAAKGLSSA